MSAWEGACADLSAGHGASSRISGRTHRVEALDTGFRYEGRAYKVFL